jgi:hypothetical protein
MSCWKVENDRGNGDGEKERCPEAVLMGLTKALAHNDGS